MVHNHQGCQTGHLEEPRNQQTSTENQYGYSVKNIEENEMITIEDCSKKKSPAIKMRRTPFKKKLELKHLKAGKTLKISMMCPIYINLIYINLFPIKNNFFHLAQFDT